MPQKLRKSADDGEVTLFFRVRRPCPKGEIVVTAGDRVILRKKRRHMTPGEMEHLPLKRELLRDVNEPITVTLVREEA